MPHVSRRVFGKAAAAATVAMVVAACGSTPAAPPSITVTFIRHAESEANAAGVINTVVPGPGLTPEGGQQAQKVANDLRGKNYDGVFASAMVRTQETAAPLAKDLGKQVQVLPGLNEISAGRFEGESGAGAMAAYFVAPSAWLKGDRNAAIPESINGNQFNNDFTAAVQKIYDSGDKNPVAFSHGAAIMVWTAMNVTNPKDSLLTTHPLPNVGRVVIRGNPTTGWTLVSWDGLDQTGS
ncbi:histidine phosphatase family protein [Mycolicibacterium komossense]|uniref:Histidine phosphatase family protein n=1 Tax=Mycolicibacterium komossense TaxID=1779 RepID=A0ABT3CD21_9MYCO|nr:histidine phosphatase family protein [Mycolicibacterium komossense]MCV7227307.1 histidine phosphatase family protein [Mycolicibacterium komossense]